MRVHLFLYMGQVTPYGFVFRWNRSENNRDWKIRKSHFGPRNDTSTLVLTRAILNLFDRVQTRSCRSAPYYDVTFDDIIGGRSGPAMLHFPLIGSEGVDEQQFVEYICGVTNDNAIAVTTTTDYAFGYFVHHFPADYCFRCLIAIMWVWATLYRVTSRSTCASPPDSWTTCRISVGQHVCSHGSSKENPPRRARFDLSCIRRPRSKSVAG